MFCDRCDRGYHTFCVGVKTIPTGRWDCPTCQSRPFDLPQLPSAKKYVATLTFLFFVYVFILRHIFILHMLVDLS